MFHLSALCPARRCPHWQQSPEGCITIPAQAPPGGMFMTASSFARKDQKEVHIHEWGRSITTRPVDKIVIRGKPYDMNVLEKLKAHLVQT